MSKKLDVDDLINWLNQSEDEAKATVARSGETCGCMIDWTHNLGYYRYSFRLQKYDLDALL